MRHPVLLAAPLLLLLLLAQAARADDRGAAEGGRLAPIARAYADGLFRLNPTLATMQGEHRYDGDLEHLDAAAIEARARLARETLDQLALIDARALSPAERIDAPFLAGRARAALRELTIDRPHERDPGLYVRLAGATVDELLKRSFAPLCGRLRAATARAGQVPRLLREGRANLQRPPRLWTELAITDVKGAAAFYGTVVPRAAAGCEDRAVRAALEAAAAGARRALGEFGGFLERDLRPRSDGSYVRGAARLREILADEELIDEPLPLLLERGRAELARLRTEFTTLARQIDPRATPEAVLAAITRQHAPAAELIPATKAQIAGIRAFVLSRHVVPIPAGEDLHVEETPVFYRQLSFASMSTPGAFEERAREAFFYVTPVEPGWSEEKKEQHMRAFDRFSLENTIIHEAYPGHYVQGLYARAAPTLVRRLLSSTAYSEGWALYCERMMLDAGLDPDPRERLIMLQWALIRAARYVGSIELHARGMAMPDLVRFLRREALLEPANAEREARRFTSDATVLAYTYGDLAIRALRARAEAKQGRAFRLEDFHRRLLEIGPVPVPLLGQALGLE